MRSVLNVWLFQKLQLDADGNPEQTDYRVDWVSACRKGDDDQPEFLIHWSGGVDKWGTGSATWQPIDSSVVLAVWEKHDLREDIMNKLGQNANGLAGLQNQLAALPEQGSRGVIDRWISATIRGQKSKGKIIGFVAPKFTVEFEQFKQGQSDPDDGDFDLLDAEVDWCFTDAPPSHSHLIDILVGERVARRNRQ